MIDGHASMLPGVPDRVAESQLSCGEAYGRQPSPAQSDRLHLLPSNKTKSVDMADPVGRVRTQGRCVRQVSVSRGPSLFYAVNN